MSENGKPRAICPACTEIIRPIVDNALARLERLEEALRRIKEMSPEW